MYEKPRFHGRKCVLAEGDVEITNPWKMYRKKGTAANAPFLIGSLKRVVRVRGAEPHFMCGRIKWQSTILNSEHLKWLVRITGTKTPEIGHRASTLGGR